MDSSTSPSEHPSQPARSLATTIRRYRKKAGLSQRKLAAKAGCDFSYLSRLERGDNDKPTPEVLTGIAKALEIDPGKLLRYIGVKPTTVIPSPRMYFRKAYGMTPDQADQAAKRMDQIVHELRDHHEHANHNKKPKGGIQP
jgi:transcriptional regulator with XRE-family HTH domain